MDNAVYRLAAHEPPEIGIKSERGGTFIMVPGGANIRIPRNLSAIPVVLMLLCSAPGVTPVTARIWTQTPNPGPAPSVSADSLDAWIDSVRKQYNIPAMAAIVLRANSVLARGIAGVRRAGLPGAVTINDRFQLGSNTKAITATLVATLVEAGKLSWTTTPGDVFPEMRDSMSPAFRGVTLEQLLSHHGGVSPFTDTDDDDFKKIPSLKGTPVECRRAFAAWVLRGKPVEPPGTKAVYSNGGYTIAAAIVERVTGESWESLIRERVFRPLGINGTFAWSESPDVEQPWGHYETRSGVKAVDPRDPNERLPPIIWPAGSVELSLDDYARFLQLNLRGLEGHDTSLLRAATIKRLHTSPVAPGDSFALGWGIQEFEGKQAHVHVGSAGAFLAVTMLQPTRDLAVAVFANAGGQRADKASKEALKTLIRRYATAAGK